MIRCDKHGYFKSVQRRDDGEKICVDVRGNVRKSSGVKGKKDCLGKCEKSIGFFFHFFYLLVEFIYQ